MITSYLFDKTQKKWYAKWKCDIFDATVDLPNATSAIENLMELHQKVTEAAKKDIAAVRDALKSSKVEIVDKPVEKRTFIHCNPIDWNTMKTMLAFLEYCHKENNSEGMLLLRYINKKWHLSCPEQWDSMGGVCYHPELHPEECTMVMGDIHSHPGFGTTHSETDHRDERKNSGIFIVVSGFTPFTCNATVHGRFRDNIFKVPPELILSDKPVEANGSKEPFPPEWKKRVHKAPCAVCEKARDAKKSKKTGESKFVDYSDYGMPGYGGYGEPDFYKRRSYSQYRRPTSSATETEEDENWDGDTVEQLINEAYETWKRVRYSHDHFKDNPRLLNCTNWGCREEIDDVLCSTCKKTIDTEEIVKDVAKMVCAVIDHVEDEEEDSSDDDTDTKADTPTVTTKE